MNQEEGNRGANSNWIREVLMMEYRVISDQIIHWDDFFWTKSRFFLGVESIALLATASEFMQALTSGIPLKAPPYWLLLGMASLNLYLCSVWLKTNIRNREFLNFRFQRGVQIEEDPALQVDSDGVRKPVLRLYHHQDETLETPPLKGKSSHYGEVSIPIVFALAWLTLLVAGISKLENRCEDGVFPTLVVLLLGWLAIKHLPFLSLQWMPPETGSKENPSQ